MNDFLLPALSVIGVDPGGTTGIATLEYAPGNRTSPLIEVSQVKGPASHAVALVGALIPEANYTGVIRVLAIEQFVVNGRAGRSSTPKGGQQAREIIGALVDLAKQRGSACFVRAAGNVKPWATDRRLAALEVSLVGLGHGGDALRHGLFAAVHDYGAPDPLSKTANKRGAA